MFGATWVTSFAYRCCQATCGGGELTWVSLQHDPGTAEHTIQKLAPPLGEPREFVSGPGHEIDFTAHARRDGLPDTCDLVPINFTDEKYIDVTARSIKTRSERPEYERDADARHGGDPNRQQMHDIALTAQELLDAPDLLARCIDGPDTKWTDASATQCATCEQVLKRELY